MTTTGRVEVAQIVTRFMAGAGGVALRGAAALDPERFHVTIVTGEGGRLLDEASAAGMEIVLVPALVSPISPRSDRAALNRLTQVCSERRFDVVHTHSAKAGVLGRLAAHRSGVGRVVHTYHGFPFHQFQSAMRRSAYVAIERRMATITDEVLAIGAGVATEALRRGLARPEHLRTITPVVDTHVVPVNARTRRAARDRLGLPPDSPVVGTVGRLDFQKAPEDFVAAIGQLADPTALGVWIGDGPDRSAAERRCRDLGLVDRVRFVGERNDVAELLPAFDVFAMTSRYEGLPCAVVEAMRCGLPVIATAVNSVPDLVVPGETGLLVPPGRPELTAVALAYLLENPDAAARMADNGHRATVTGYEPHELGAVLTQVYGGTRWIPQLAAAV